MKSMFHPSLLIYLIFLAVYSWQKYRAAAPASFNQGYAINVAILVTLTAIVPYVVARLAMSMTSGAGRLASAVLVPTFMAAGGFATFFFVFIAPNFPQVELMTVLPRSLTPGGVIAVILLIHMVLRRGEK
jgi:hypothetical protein